MFPHSSRKSDTGTSYSSGTSRSHEMKDWFDHVQEEDIVLLLRRCGSDRTHVECSCQTELVLPPMKEKSTRKHRVGSFCAERGISLLPLDRIQRTTYVTHVQRKALEAIEKAEGIHREDIIEERKEELLSAFVYLHYHLLEMYRERVVSHTVLFADEESLRTELCQIEEGARIPISREKCAAEHGKRYLKQITTRRLILEDDMTRERKFTAREENETRRYLFKLYRDTISAVKEKLAADIHFLNIQASEFAKAASRFHSTVFDQQPRLPEGDNFVMAPSLFKKTVSSTSFAIPTSPTAVRSDSSGDFGSGDDGRKVCFIPFCGTNVHKIKRTLEIQELLASKPARYSKKRMDECSKAIRSAATSAESSREPGEERGDRYHQRTEQDGTKKNNKKKSTASMSSLRMRMRAASAHAKSISSVLRKQWWFDELEIGKLLEVFVAVYDKSMIGSTPPCDVMGRQCSENRTQDDPRAMNPPISSTPSADTLEGKDETFHSADENDSPSWKVEEAPVNGVTAMPTPSSPRSLHSGTSTAVPNAPKGSTTLLDDDDDVHGREGEGSSSPSPRQFLQSASVIVGGFGVNFQDELGRTSTTFGATLGSTSQAMTTTTTRFGLTARTAEETTEDERVWREVLQELALEVEESLNEVRDAEDDDVSSNVGNEASSMLELTKVVKTVVPALLTACTLLVKLEMGQEAVRCASDALMYLRDYGRAWLVDESVRTSTFIPLHILLSYAVCALEGLGMGMALCPTPTATKEMMMMMISKAPVQQPSTSLSAPLDKSRDRFISSNGGDSLTMKSAVTSSSYGTTSGIATGVSLVMHAERLSRHVFGPFDPLTQRLNSVSLTQSILTHSVPQLAKPH